MIYAFLTIIGLLAFWLGWIVANEWYEVLG